MKWRNNKLSHFIKQLIQWSGHLCKLSRYYQTTCKEQMILMKMIKNELNSYQSNG